LVFGPDSNLYVGSFGTGDVFRYNGTTGTFMDDFVAAGSGALGGPTFLIFGEGGSAATPEPSTLGLLACGLAALAAWKQFSRRLPNKSLKRVVSPDAPFCRSIGLDLWPFRQ
jgi:hypothetical protein